MQWGSGVTKPGGHFIEIGNLQRGLANDIAEYNRLRCDEDDPGSPGFGAIAEDVLDAATQPVPPPRPPQPAQMQAPSSSSSSLLSSVALALAALLGIALAPAGL